MNKEEKVKKLKWLIKKIQRAIDEISWLRFDAMDVLEEHNYMLICNKNEKVVEGLRIEKSYLEDELKSLQESKENTTNL